MAIPDYQSLMRPLLEFAADGKEHSVAEAREALAALLKLTDAERNEMLPSGRQPIFTNRVAWAKVYLGQAGVVDSTKRGWFRINERGKQLLKDVPGPITVKHLERFPDFNLFRKRSNEISDEQQTSHTEQQTPERYWSPLISDFAVSLQLRCLRVSRRPRRRSLSV